MSLSRRRAPPRTSQSGHCLGIGARTAEKKKKKKKKFQKQDLHFLSLDKALKHSFDKFS